MVQKNIAKGNPYDSESISHVTVINVSAQTSEISSRNIPTFTSLESSSTSGICMSQT